jgi:multiple sugar transport system ATP-binding protein
VHSASRAHDAVRVGGPVDGTGLAGVTVVRGGTTVLRDVTLEAAEGELLVVLGLSGSGKSTLLRALAGLDETTSGRVFIKGHDVTTTPPGRRRVSMVFQASALFPHLDVSRNLGWGLRIQQLPEADVQQRVSGLARQLRLSRLLSRKPGQLSGGERGVVGIGHALVQTPDVFLLDEPLGDLDAAQRTDVRRRIVEVVRSLGVPTFYVTHDQAEGLAIADRVALLHEGGVVQVGTPRDLYERPVNLLVTTFVGTPPIGLMTARLVAADGQAGFEVGRRTLPTWRPVPPPLRDCVGRDVVLGLRAEDVHDATAGPAPDTVALDGVVTSVEYTGRHSVVTVAVGAPPVTAPGIESPRAATLRSFFPPRLVVRAGDAVRVSVEAARAHVFDASTGAALWHPDGPPAAVSR